METTERRKPSNLTTAHAAAAESVMIAIRAHLRGEAVAPLYLATGQDSTPTTIPVMVADELRTVGRSDRLLICTGTDFVSLWHDTLRRGMTPIIRRALDAKQAIVLGDLEALGDEPVAAWELARLLTPGRLAILFGHGHLRHVAAWSPTLSTRLANATGLCLHAGPCVTDTDAWVLIDRVARYYGLTQSTLLSRRRPSHIALARQVAMHLLRQEGLTATRVGLLLRRDHATVLHGDARIRQLGARQCGLQYDLDALRRATVG